MVATMTGKPPPSFRRTWLPSCSWSHEGQMEGLVRPPPPSDRSVNCSSHLCRAPAPQKPRPPFYPMQCHHQEDRQNRQICHPQECPEGIHVFATSLNGTHPRPLLQFILSGVTTATMYCETEALCASHAGTRI